MTITEIFSVVAACGSLVAMIVGVGTLKARNAEQAARLARMEAALEYLKEAVGRIDIAALNERIVIVEQSVLRAHERIDELQAGRKNGN